MSHRFSSSLMVAGLVACAAVPSLFAQFSVISRSGHLTGDAIALGRTPGYIFGESSPIESVSSVGITSSDDLSLSRPLFFGPDSFGRLYEGSYTGQLDQTITPTRISTRLRAITYASALSLGSPEANAARATMAGEQTLHIRVSEATTVNLQVRFAGTPGPGGSSRDRIVLRVVEFVGTTPVFSLLDLAFIPGVGGPDRQDGSFSTTLQLMPGDGYLVYSAVESLDDDSITPNAPSPVAMMSYQLSLPGECDNIDFNDDGLFPDDQDLIDFLSVLAGGPCSTNTCNDIDFNNDGLFPDDNDLIAFLSVLAGGSC